MKIVHVEDYIHPDAGYQVNVLAPLQVKQGHSVEVVTAEIEKIPDHISGFFGRSHMEERDHKFFDEFKVSIHRIPLHAFVSGRAIFHAYTLFNKVRELSPDVVFVHGEDTYAGMLFILFSRWASYPIVLDCHMLEMASKNRFKNAFRLFFRKVMTPIILSRSIPLIRVVDSDFVEKHFGIPLSKTHYFPLGTDTGMFAPKPQDKTRLRQEYGLSPSAFVVLYAGKLDEQKGGALLGRAIAEKFPSIGDGK